MNVTVNLNNAADDFRATLGIDNPVLPAFALCTLGVLDNNGNIALFASAGFLFQRTTYPLRFTKQSAPTAKTVTDTLTAAEILAGWITVNQGAAGACTLTTPTGTLLKAALPADLAAGDCFDFHVINISTVGAEDCTIAGGTDVTIVGNAVVNSNDAGATQSQGTFRFRYTGGTTFVAYRLS